MRITSKSRKAVLSLVLTAAILLSVVASTLVVSAKKVDEIAPQGTENYYLWGQNTNDPDFGGMNAPTGSFSYDGTKGYYYYDLSSMSGGDYCFVVSKVNNSGATAVRTPALGGVGNSGKYYLSQGNYHGYACMHLWNPAGEAIRIYFTSEGAGLNAIPLSEAGSVGPGPGPTPTTGPSPGGTGTVYCEDAAGWGNVCAYMWNSDSDKNATWPGQQMTKVSGNVWSYTYPKSFSKIIFNIGSERTQTDDLDFPGDGYIYNNATKKWSVYGGTTPTTGPVNPTTAPPTPSGSYVYCKDSAGWGNVCAYMWNSETDANAKWPGEQMTDMGGNVWRYAVPKDFTNIIFNIGSERTQTTDLTYPGAGYIYDNASGSWSKYGSGSDPTVGPGPGPTPTTQQPTTGPGPSGQKVVYCDNEAGWSTVSVYMWNASGSVNNGAWPGVAATKIGNNIWKYVLPKDFEKVIFSESGNNQTDDLSFPGSGYMYNNKTKEWSIYDTSPLQVQSFGTDLESPQYAGVGVTLTATATGEGTVYYKFSVGTTVLHDYNTNNTAVWTPTSAGTYTLTYEFKDSKGNTNKRTGSYTITDGSSVTAPYIKTVTPSNGNQIKRSADCTVKVSAGGGNVGTKKLFYKYTLKDSGNNTVNVPYYTRNTSFTFKPTALGKYTVVVSVQGNDNNTIERSYVYNSVDNVTNPTEAGVPAEQPTQQQQQPTQPKPTVKPQPGTLIGDADSDNDITILDATRIQRWLADLVTDDQINKTNADVDFDGDVTIIDATRIQRFIAGLITEFKKA